MPSTKCGRMTRTTSTAHLFASLKHQGWNDDDARNFAFDASHGMTPQQQQQAGTSAARGRRHDAFSGRPPGREVLQRAGRSGEQGRHREQVSPRRSIVGDEPLDRRPREAQRDSAGRAGLASAGGGASAGSNGSQMPYSTGAPSGSGEYDDSSDYSRAPMYSGKTANGSLSAPGMYSSAANASSNLTAPGMAYRDIPTQTPLSSAPGMAPITTAGGKGNIGLTVQNARLIHNIIAQQNPSMSDADLSNTFIDKLAGYNIAGPQAEKLATQFARERASGRAGGTRLVPTGRVPVSMLGTDNGMDPNQPYNAPRQAVPGPAIQQYGEVDGSQPQDMGATPIRRRTPGVPSSASPIAGARGADPRVDAAPIGSQAKSDTTKGIYEKTAQGWVRVR